MAAGIAPLPGPSSCGGTLVELHVAGHVIPLVADVSHLDHRVAPNLPLYVEIPHLHVRSCEVALHGIDVGGRIDHEGRVQVHGREAGASLMGKLTPSGVLYARFCAQGPEVKGAPPMALLGRKNMP